MENFNDDGRNDYEKLRCLFPSVRNIKNTYCNYMNYGLTAEKIHYNMGHHNQEAHLIRSRSSE